MKVELSIVNKNARKLCNLKVEWQYSYCPTTTQTEIGLVLEGPGNTVWAVEIKRSAAPVLSKGFHTACEDIGATRKFVVYAGTERFPMSGNTEAIGLMEFLQLVHEKDGPAPKQSRL